MTSPTNVKVMQVTYPKGHGPTRQYESTDARRPGSGCVADPSM